MSVGIDWRSLIVAYWPQLLVGSVLLAGVWQVASAVKWQTKIINRRIGR